jgi:hypothetical protein
MPRKIEEKKRGFSLVESHRVEELFINLTPSAIRVKSQDADRTTYAMAVEIVIGNHERSAIVSAFRHLGSWFEEQVRSGNILKEAAAPDKKTGSPRQHALTSMAAQGASKGKALAH